MTKYLKVYTNKRMLTTLLLGFSSGLPLALTGGTLQAWLTDAKVDIATIGKFALISMPYALKFLWAPFIDSYHLPFLGLRRGWAVVCQLGLFAATVAMAFTVPAENLPLFSLMAFLLAFFSASQDIVVDAFRTEIVTEKEMGAGAGTYISGYRIATLVSGGVALGMADYFQNSLVAGGTEPVAAMNLAWTYVYIGMAFVNLIGVATVLLSPEPKVVRQSKKFNVKDSIISPFTEFFQRTGAMEILTFIMIYKLSTLMATALTTTFLLTLEYSKTEIGATFKGIGLIATIAGTLVGGSMMLGLGIKRSLWIFGICQAMVGLTFCALDRLVLWTTPETVLLGIGAPALKTVWLCIIVSIDNFMMGLGTAALTGFMMNFSSKRFPGTQLALFTSILAVARVILISQAGVMQAAMGWDLFFISTIPLALPGLLMLYRYDHWQAMPTAAKKKISRLDLALIGLFGVSLIAMSSDPVWTYFDMKDQARLFVVAGAVGVVVFVTVGLLRPYFGSGRIKKVALS